jgi:hypothetical protein
MISYYYWPKGSIHIPRPGEIRQASLTGEKGGIVGGSRFFAGKGAWIRRVEGLEGMSTRIGEDGGRGRSRVLQNASPPTRALESAAPPETPLPPDLPHLPRETLPGAASGAGSVYGGVGGTIRIRRQRAQDFRLRLRAHRHLDDLHPA